MDVGRHLGRMNVEADKLAMRQQEQLVPGEWARVREPELLCVRTCTYRILTGHVMLLH